MFCIQVKLYSIKMVPIPTPITVLYSTYSMNHGLFHSPNSHVIVWKLKLLWESRHHATNVYMRCRPKPTCIPALRSRSNCVIRRTYSLPLSPWKEIFLQVVGGDGCLVLGPPTPPSNPAPLNDTASICISSSHRECHVSRCDSGAISVLRCCNNGIISRYDKAEECGSDESLATGCGSCERRWFHP